MDTHRCAVLNTSYNGDKNYFTHSSIWTDTHVHNLKFWKNSIVIVKRGLDVLVTVEYIAYLEIQKAKK